MQYVEGIGLLKKNFSSSTTLAFLRAEHNGIPKGIYISYPLLARRVLRLEQTSRRHCACPDPKRDSHFTL